MADGIRRAPKNWGEVRSGDRFAGHVVESKVSVLCANDYPHSVYSTPSAAHAAREFLANAEENRNPGWPLVFYHVHAVVLNPEIPPVSGAAVSGEQSR